MTQEWQTTPIEMDSKQAFEFLELLDPTGRHHLVTLTSKGPAGFSFRCTDGQDALSDFLISNAHADVYYTANEVDESFHGTKPRKGDIASIRAVYADIDVDPKDLEYNKGRALQTVLEGAGGELPHPNYVIDSGGGIQALWLLNSPDMSHSDAELIGYCIKEHLGSDAVQNVERLLRLPGTINQLTERKKKKGRVQARKAELTNIFSKDKQNPQDFSDVVRSYKHLHKVVEDREDEISAHIDLVEAIDIAGLEEQTRAFIRKDKDYFKPLWEGNETELPDSHDVSGSAYRAELARRIAKRAGAFETYVTAVHLWADSYEFPIGFKERDSALSPRSLARDWVNCGLPVHPSRMFEPVKVDDVMTKTQQRIQEIKSETKETKFLFEPIADVAAQAFEDDAPHLIKGLLDQEAQTVLYGASNTGKTFVALDIAYHIAVGKKFTNMPTQQANVIYVAAEGGRGMAKRAAALTKKYGPVPTEAFRIMRSPIDLLRPDADLDPLLEAILELNGTNTGIIVLDTLSRVMAGGDENSSVDMGALQKHLDIIRMILKAHVFVIHHSGKDSAKGARGHSLLRAATDTEIEVSNGVVRVTKQRDMEGDFKRSFTLEDEFLGNNKHGEVVKGKTVHMSEISHDGPIDIPQHTQEDILKGAQEAWDTGLGWSDSYQSGARYIVRIMASKYGVEDENIAKEMVDFWLATGKLIRVVQDQKNKKIALKVVEGD